MQAGCPARVMAWVCVIPRRLVCLAQAESRSETGYTDASLVTSVRQPEKPVCARPPWNALARC
jgi:hypothetical protein